MVRDRERSLFVRKGPSKGDPGIPQRDSGTVEGMEGKMGSEQKGGVQIDLYIIPPSNSWSIMTSDNFRY